MKRNKQQGLIIQIVIIVIALIALGAYLKWDVVGFFQKTEVKNFISGTWNFLKALWHYVKIGFEYVISLF